ncbi:MAG: ABC transporter ATP-binding protein/permease [Mogibacterium sp.]|nr:ABC transporter ATP-binding protein/permease [Mogibacterium sp.]
MLELKNITKEYVTGAETVKALKGVSLAFRPSEFVAILGPSGCGKTTMLNIMGGLDQYTSGDLVIGGVSTKKYRDADWDAYRNDTIGFVFQSYNLISHQSVLANVELALTLSGVSKAERRRRAVAALEQVGLGDQINKKPAEMSGGQVQRVAIARALINDPDIILADEPTGALDTETSTQVMDILKDISTRKLVIMVTHNPELASQYATRVIRLTDGKITSDSNPFMPAAAAATASIPALSNAAAAGASPAASVARELAGHSTPQPSASSTAKSTDNNELSAAVSRRARGRKNKSMSMLTALQLSMNNLMTKKARTFLTAFAGSIGIIGIALILSVSNGFQKYIDKLEEDTLSSYPLTIQTETADMTSMISAFAANAQDTEGESSGDNIHEQQIMTDLLASVGTNDLAAFKKRIESNIGTVGKYFNAYDFTYGLSVNIYSTDMKYGPLRVSPGSIMQSYMSGFQQSNFSMMNTDVFFRMMDNEELLKTQYKVLAGRWPEKYDELLLVLDSEDQLNDYIVYTIGLRDPQELKDMINDVMNGEEVENTNKRLEWTYDDFLGKEFALVHACDTYRRNSDYDVWEDMTDDDEYMEDLIKKSEKLKITGIVCAKEQSGANAMDSGIGYLPTLTNHMIEYAKESEIVKIQRAHDKIDVFSGKTFEEIRNKESEGLGFDDMISIDEAKLKSALGGDVDPNAVKKQIEEIAKDEIEALSEKDSAEKITADITDAFTKHSEGMIDNLKKQSKKNPDKFKIDKKSVSKALAANLDDGKYADLVNGLLKGYAVVLEKSGPEIQEQTNPVNIIMTAFKEAGMDITKKQAEELLALSGDKEALTQAILAQMAQPNPAIAGMLAEQISELAANADEALWIGLEQTIEPYIESDKTQKEITKIAKALEMLETSKVVSPALMDTANAVAGQFHVDPSGIADAFTMKMDEDEITRLITAYVSGGEESSYDRNLRKLGYADIDNPYSMMFYLKDFESKEAFLKFIDDYNKEMQDNGDYDMVISYTDITGVLIKSVKTITNAVSYVLIAFVAISLIVSSIMIGVITYISVLERTKEIGILRAIGASKKDIARIFNAETIIVGLCAGVIGIVASLVLLIPINKILIGLTNIAALKAVLPPLGGAALIVISIFLTFIAGLIPSGMAARKDPVVALRTE